MEKDLTLCRGEPESSALPPRSAPAAEPVRPVLEATKQILLAVAGDEEHSFGLALVHLDAGSVPLIEALDAGCVQALGPCPPHR